MTDIVVSQLLDPFRIVLLVAMVMTACNTAAVVGMAAPLALGAIFVAVLLPITTQAGGADTTTAILTGLVVNGVLIAVILAARTVWKRLTASGGA